MQKEVITQLLNETATLLELHGESAFKIQSYRRAAQQLERNFVPESTFQSYHQLTKIPGIGPNLAQHIHEIYTKGTFQVREMLRAQTPPGILQILTLKGLGPKKIRTIWLNLGIESIDELLKACQENKIASLPGFGQKTQASIEKSIEFRKNNDGKWLYASVIHFIEQLVEAIQQKFPKSQVSIAGAARRKLEIIDEAVVVADNTIQEKLIKWFTSIRVFNPGAHLVNHEWRASFLESDFLLRIVFTEPKDFYQTLIKETGSQAHLSLKFKGKETIQQVLEHTPITSEEEFYQKLDMPFIAPELREGIIEMNLPKKEPIQLIGRSDIKGIFHAHTHYSDGKASLKEMAIHCKEQGFEYLGISDHSQTAAYAGGLTPNIVRRQQEEIDRLNEELAPFKIFKGIESDILPNGDLDYPAEILDSFDFVIASVHSALTMDQDRATQRLLKAIKNPYTTFLGHATGRLLLRRDGYPINHEAVIAACAEHGVIIELNANPNRLDIDWRWIPTVLARKVLISINPDAHSTDGFNDIEFGINVARKGGLTAQYNFTSFTLNQVEKYLEKKRNSRSI